MNGCAQNGQQLITGAIVYQPPVYEDLRTPASGTNIGAANDPQFLSWLDNGAGSVGVYCWQFRPNVSEELFFTVQLAHSWLEASALQPHIHWVPLTNAPGDVIWNLEYTVATPNAVFPSTTIDSVTSSAVGVANTHQISSWANIPMPSNKISTVLSCRVVREGTDPADTFPDNAGLLEIDFHIKLNTPGSKLPWVK